MLLEATVIIISSWPVPTVIFVETEATSIVHTRFSLETAMLSIKHNIPYPMPRPRQTRMFRIALPLRVKPQLLNSVLVLPPFHSMLPKILP